MSQEPEKYMYFNVGLLKNSFALESLWQDALKYHLIDEPGKLIALRLTEYYELVARGGLHAGANRSLAAMHAAIANTDGREEAASANSSGSASQANGHPDRESIVSASPDMEENADEAAEYWASM